MKFLFLSTLLLFSALFCSSLAQDDLAVEETFEEDLAVEDSFEEPLQPLNLDHITYVFPDNPNEAFVAGERADVLLGFKNAGSSAVTIKSIQGHLVHPLDFSYHLQNYTQFHYEATVMPTEEVTLEYSFQPSEMLDERPFGLYITVHFTDDLNNNYTHPFFNNTVNILEPDMSVDLDTFFKWCLIIGGALLVAFVVYKIKSSTKSGKKKVEYGTRQSGEVEDEWLQGTSVSLHKRKSKVKGKRR